ncbi:MAG: hypothetical protein GX088_08595 [Clostridia bacterium]|nr:hypothetical protein [Clostridia bacterium]
MNIATYAIDIAALVYLTGLLHYSNALNIYRKKPFLIGIFLTIIVIVSEAGTVLADNGILTLRSTNILCNVLGFSLTPLIPIAITLIFEQGLLEIIHSC